MTTALSPKRSRAGRSGNRNSAKRVLWESIRATQLAQRSAKNLQEICACGHVVNQAISTYDRLLDNTEADARFRRIEELLHAKQSD